MRSKEGTFKPPLVLFQRINAQTHAPVVSKAPKFIVAKHETRTKATTHQPLFSKLYDSEDSKNQQLSWLKLK